MAVVRQGPPPVTGASNAGVEGTSRIVGDSWLSMDWWRAGPVNNNCDNLPCTYGDASVNLFIAVCSMHDYDYDEDSTELHIVYYTQC